MAKQKKQTRVVVLGGAGAMGRITVRDLFETAPDVHTVVADYNERAARALVKSLKGKGRLSAVAADVNDPQGTVRLLEGAFAVINCVQHDYNVDVMTAALEAGCHYVDLGGLFHVTGKQRALDGEFKKANLLALLGMGAAPGITNLLARAAADEMEKVTEIHTYVAGVDPGHGAVDAPLSASYSLQTILEEASNPAAFFTKGKMTFVPAMSHADPQKFPKPVGLRHPACTIHSEVATLPDSYQHKGVREVSFRIAFPNDLVAKLSFLRAMGLLSTDAVQVKDAEVVPREMVLALTKRIPPPAGGPVVEDYEIVRAVVRGKLKGKKVEQVLDCHVPGIPEWGMGVDVDTGCPPSICVQMLARGDITERGALPAEKCVPCAPFFKELEKRHMKVKRSRRALA